jgi:hypothetical protein
MYYAKKISGRFRLDKREEGLKMVSEFWNSNMSKVQGLKGFMFILDPYNPELELATNITVWESKQFMDELYLHNASYSTILEKI